MKKKKKIFGLNYLDKYGTRVVGGISRAILITLTGEVVTGEGPSRDVEKDEENDYNK